MKIYFTLDKTKYLAFFVILFLGLTNTTVAQITQRGTSTTGNSTNNTLTINKPTGVIQGDIMLVNISQREDSGNNLSTASLAGWTSIVSSDLGSTTRWGNVLYKVAGAAEPANYTFTLDNDADVTVGSIVAFSGVNNTTPIDVTGAFVTANGGTGLAPTTITTLTNNAAVMMFSMSGGSSVSWSGWSTVTSPGALTELYDNLYNNGDQASVGAAWAIKATAGNTGNGSVTISTSERRGGILIALRPSIPPTITSLAGSPACAGGNITINGTNLTGATSVTIGGTPVASITTNTATQIVAVIGTGTTGQVAVTTPGGSANSGATNFTVTPLTTITLTSAAGTNNQTRCINTLITPITYSLTGGGVTGATVSGLPAGVTSLYAAGTLTISGTPTASGTFNYTVNSTGGCTNTATGTITVSALPTATLSSAAGTNNQTVCQNASITNIAYNIGGSATGASASGLPAGVSGNYAAGVFTISGTPLASGIFNYTVTTSGGPCTAATALGTITVNSLPAVPGNPTSNSPQCNPGGVTITQSGSAPVGVTWYWQTIAAGTSTANNASTPWVVNTSGTYYIRAYNGNCWSNGAGSVAVTVNNPINSLATVTSPTNGATGICYIGTGATTQISWGAAAGASGYDVYFGTTASPALVSSNQAGTTWTISPALVANTTYYWKIVPRNICGVTTGTPVNWTFTTGSTPCYCTPSSSTSLYYIAGVSSEGTLTNGTNSPTGYSAGGYGNYTAITMASQIPGGGINININLQGAGGQGMRTYVDWNNDGIFADPAEEVYNTGSTLLTGPTTYGFVVPSGQTPGNYRIRIRSRGASTIDPCSNLASGEAEDYTIVVVADCTQKITSVTNGSACGSPNTVNLSAVSAGATGFRWYSAETGGSLLATTAAGNWTTPSIATTTTYYVTAYNGTCESLYRTPVKATILTTTNITVTPSTPTICGDNNPISITAAGDTTQEDLLVQDFESGMAPFTATIPTNTNAGADSPWSVKTSPYQPSGTSVWKPAINSGSVATIGNKFALTTSDYNGSNIVSIITSPIVNPSAYTSLTLTFDHYYSNFSGDTAAVQVSVNGGAFAAITPTPALYNTDIGTPSDFVTQTVDLSAYALPANTSLQFRFVYTAQFDDGWAVDNIKLSGVKPLNTTFTWSGGVDAFTDAACTIPYVAQSVTTIYVKPNATQINSPSWAFTATATLSNGCAVVKNITVTNNTKSWTGASSTLWNDANNWVPAGVPTSANCVVIPSTTQITGSGYNALAKNVTIKSTGNLELQSSNNLTVSDEITVVPSGVFNVRNNANLVQVNNVANSGNINMERTANIRRLDYVYWSSAVANFPVTSISPGTSSGFIYKWLPTTPTAYASNFGAWSNTTENMVTGKGYIVRGPNAYSTSVLTNYTATFTGVPNNGIITTPISRSTYNGASYAGPTSTLVTANDDNFNLVGNPYPSSIRAIDFLNANSNIAGFVNIWTHGTLPTTSAPNPYYANYTYNYTTADYITYNVSGTSSGPGTFNGYIGSGQGFFVLMNHTSAATTETVTFNNTMRSAAYSNSQFYKTSENDTPVDIERNRIWLDLIKSSDLTNRRAMVGYIEGATNEKDRLYDALGSEKMNFNIYSVLDNEAQIIQGRSLPFDSNDQVQLGVNIPQDGEYKIGIATLDGLFTDAAQNIYIEDKVLNITHNIKSSPYTFMANTGRSNDRFVLKFVDQSLSNDDNTFANDIKIYATNHLNIESLKLDINTIEVYDIVGKNLLSLKNIQQKQLTVNQLKPTTNVILVKVTLENGSVVTKKVIY
ncbi:GEVED domain-containing protein [Flavobacterium amniphilum]|uniref:GEVED domain-containing protein n=1 Tax=Flavobacterium amniphilum TaxID=1834035 RepID=UPI002029E5A5|nr:GEVED domain-containing protein [Flavobacterium amniphilum]MCL9804616.1 GEVED domain-containing protein [Flavobacterium amniphilum]